MHGLHLTFCRISLMHTDLVSNILSDEKKKVTNLDWLTLKPPRFGKCF